MFQGIIVFLLVTVSFIYLICKYWRQFFTKTESCDGCAISKKSNLINQKKTT